MKINGSLGIAVIFPHLGAKSAFWREIPPYMGGTTPIPNEPVLLRENYANREDSVVIARVFFPKQSPTTTRRLLPEGSQ